VGSQTHCLKKQFCVGRLTLEDREATVLLKSLNFLPNETVSHRRRQDLP